MECECNYHLEMGQNLLCPVHGKREDLDRKIKQLQSELKEAKDENEHLCDLIDAVRQENDDYLNGTLEGKLKAELKEAKEKIEKLRKVLEGVCSRCRNLETVVKALK